MVLPLTTWPVVGVDVDFTAGPPSTPGSNRRSINRVNGLGVWDIDTKRGRQYELGMCETGTATLVVSDPQEVLNPGNASSPYMTGGNTILPYRALLLYALWPVSGNIINSKVNTAFDPSFESGTSGFTTGDSGGSLTSSTTQHFDGTHSLRVQLTGPSSSCQVTVPTSPGLTYTWSAYVMRDTTSTGTSITLGAITALGPRSSASTSTSWTRLSVTFMAVEATTVLTVYLDGGPTGSGAQLAWVDATQLEWAIAPSTFTTTGPTFYPIHTGYVERWPQTWDMAGFRGIKPLESVDALSPLSRAVINQSYASTISVDKPTVYIPYNDLSAPAIVQRPSGGIPMQGYVSQGTNGQIVFNGAQFLDSSPAVVITQQNANPVTSGDQNYITHTGTRAGTFGFNGQNFTFELWLKWTSGVVHLGLATTAPGETIGALGFGHYLGLSVNGGKLYYWWQDPASGSGSYLGAVGSGPGGWTGFPDGQWHYLAVTLKATNAFTARVDAYQGGTGSVPFTPSRGIGVNNLFAEATTYFGDPVSQVAIANFAAYPSGLTSTQTNNHYQRGIGYQGELPGARVARLLMQYWGSNYTAATGIMALAPDYYWNPVASSGGTSTPMSVLAAMQDIAISENGLVYVNAAGSVVFEDRSSRYSSQTSLYTFGENTAAGELPYENLEFDFDPTYVYSQANLTRPGNTAFAPMVNSTTQASYGQRVLSQSLQASSDYDLTQAGTFYLARYGTPKQRIRSMRVSPARNPNLFAAILALEISNRVTVKRRTSAGVTISADYYVESIAHSIRASEGDWDTTLELSPVFVPQAWVLGDATYGVLGSTTTPIY